MFLSIICVFVRIWLYVGVNIITDPDNVDVDPSALVLMFVVYITLLNEMYVLTIEL